jgi:hypothetical protein
VAKPTFFRSYPKYANEPHQVGQVKAMDGFGSLFDASGLSTGATTVRDELGLTVTDFFVYNPAEGSQVINYWWDLAQNFMNSVNDSDTGPFTGETMFSRVRSVEVWAMPRRAIVQNNPESFYTVNVQTPAVGNESSTSAKAAAITVTNVVPTFTNSWKKCFKCDFDKTFNDTQLQPYVSSEKMILFQLAVTNPSTGDVFPVSVPTESGEQTTRTGIQFRVVVKLDQPIAPKQQALFNLVASSSFATPGAPGQVTDQYAQVSCDGRLDMM